MKAIKKPIGRTIYGYQPGGLALSKLGLTDVPSHAIVGVAPESSATEVALDFGFFLFRIASVDSLLGGDFFHDTIVPTESQRGNISGVTAYRRFNDVLHASSPVGESLSDEATDLDIFVHTRDLLLAPADSNLFGRFREKPYSGDEMPPYDCPTIANAMDRGIPSAVTSAVQATFSPAEGTVFAPGETVRFSYNVTGGGPLDSALFVVDGGMRRIDGPSPFEFDYTLPSNKTGRVDIFAIIERSGTELYAVETHILVEPGQAPKSISATPAELRFDRIGASYPLRVTGEFPGGRVIDITAAAGTAYATESGTENVASIDAGGVVVARGPGEDRRSRAICKHSRHEFGPTSRHPDRQMRG